MNKIVGLFCLIIFSVFIFRYNNVRPFWINEHKCDEQLEKVIEMKNYLIDESYVNIKNSYYVIGKNEDVFKTHPIFNNEGYKLIFYFRSDMCNVCVDQELKNLIIVSDEIGVGNVVLLSRGFSNKYINNEKKLKGWVNKVVLDDAGFSFEEHVESPVILFLDNENNVIAKYFSSKNNSKYFELFYDYFIKSIN